MKLKEYATVDRWLGRLGVSSRKPRTSHLTSYMAWLKERGGEFKDFDPDQLIQYQKEADNGARYDLLDLAQKYVLQSAGTLQTKTGRYSSIRSFFSHNRAELPRDKFNITAGNGITEPVQGTLTVEEIKNTILASNPAFRGIFTCMFQGALDQEMFTYWNDNGYSDLMKQLAETPEIIKIELPGRKRGRNIRPFYTFIGSDGIEAIRNWLGYREEYVKRGKLPEDSELIFCNQFGTRIAKSAIHQYWIRKLRRLGIVNTTHERTGKGPHEMRDVWRTLWSKSPASHTVGEYCMGHIIDKLNYDKSFRDVELYRYEYTQAAPFLNIMSSGAAFGRVEKTEVDNLKAEVKRLEVEKTDEMAAMREKMDRMEKMFVEVFDNPAALEETKRRLSS